MRTIRKLIGTDENVWLYLDSRETWEEFVNMAFTEGFHFGELPFEKWSFGYVISVHNNGDLRHLPLFIWCWSFSNKVKSFPRKIDFKRYIHFEDDYYSTVSGFTGRLIYSSENNMI